MNKLRREISWMLCTPPDHENQKRVLLKCAFFFLLEISKKMYKTYWSLPRF